MTKFQHLLHASALALAASASSAFADVTAEDVWAQWQSWMTQSGQTVTVGGQEKVGNTLTLTDVAMSVDMPEGSLEATMSTLTFTENGDGTVTVVLPPEYPMSMTMRPEGQPEATMDVVVRQTGVTSIASGDPGSISYAFAGEELAVDIDMSQPEGEQPMDMTMTLALGGLSGNYNLSDEGAMGFTSSANASTLALDLDVTDPAGEGNVSMTWAASNITSSSSGNMPAGVDPADMVAMMAAGFAASGGVKYGSSTFSFDFADAGEQMSMAGSDTSGTFDFAMSPEGLSYKTGSQGLDVTVSGNAIPPMAMKLDEAAFGLTMPITKSETPQPVALLVKLVGLSVSEELWGMIDPAGALPHDPATLIVDIAGTANWLVDIMAPDAEAQMAAGMPGMLHSLDLKELKVAIAGADLSGKGAFTFSPDDTFAWGGMLAPEGTLDLTLVGANALIDKLVGMGLIPQDAAMQGRMMMGMIARPGEGEDTLLSTIEVKKEGSVFANGMQLK